MDETTALLKLPYIMPSQAQKHVTHNEALRMLDAILHIKVEDSGRTEPPDDPADGQRHALGAEPAGAFAGRAGHIAAFQDGAWNFHEPRAGWVIWDVAAAALLVHDGSGWVPAAPDPETLPLLGLNTSADATNRLAVASPATLLTHDGGGHQLKINKAEAGATASLLFQTAWSGRAEMGLAGTDDFSIKVSADGSLWNTALVADRATGNVSTPARLGVGTSEPLATAHVAGAMALGSAVTQARLTSGTPGNAGRVLSLIDPAAVIRVWRRQTAGNSATVELAVGDGSDNITDPSIRRWDFGVTYNTNRFEFRYLTGTAQVAMSIQSDMRIGLGTQTPHASAHLEVASTSRGFLPPRMDSAHRDAIASPAEGLMVYNTSTHEPEFWNGTAWVGMAGA